MKTLIVFYFRHKKLCLLLAAACVVAATLNFPELAHAADPTPTGKDLTAGSATIMQTVNEIFNIVIRITSSWLWPVILMIGSLLDNDLIFGGAMGERLLAVWVQIRNLVNIVFVLVLVAIAIYNVLGLGEEAGGLPLGFKAALPKLILAIVAVNFSFLAAKVVLDFTNVMTGVAFSLPSTILQGQEGDLMARAEQSLCSTPSEEAALRPLYCDGDHFNDRAKEFFSRLDRSNISMAYAIRFGHVPQLKFIRDGLEGLGQLGFNIIFNTVLYVVYALSFIALFLVLLLRLVTLWVGVILSPLIALSIAFPNLKELAGEGGELSGKFVQDAIAPIKIGLVLSLGYIMLDGFEADKSIHGNILSSSALSAVDPFSLPTDIHDLQQLMIAVAVLAIVWIGVFSAAEKTTAKSITGFIQERAETFGKWTASLPKYAQIIPTGGKLGRDNMSLANLTNTGRELMSNWEREHGGSLLHNDKASKADLAAWSTVARTQGEGELITALRNNSHALQSLEVWKDFKEGMRQRGVESDVFDARFGTAPPKENDYAAAKRIADELFKTYGRVIGGTPEDLAQRIATKQEPAAAPAVVTDVSKILEGSAAQVKANPKFSDSGWKEDDNIKALIAIRPEVREIVLPAEVKGKVPVVLAKDLNAAQQAYTELKAATDITAIQKVITALEATTLTTTQKKRFLDFVPDTFKSSAKAEFDKIG